MGTAYKCGGDVRCFVFSIVLFAMALSGGETIHLDVDFIQLF